MFCKFCGKELNDEAKFCKFCGGNLKDSENHTHAQTEQVNTPTYTYAQKPKKPFNPWGWIIAGVILIVIIASAIDESASTSGTSSNTYSNPTNSDFGFNTEPTESDYSLPHGTVLKESSYYMSGYGELKISNGTRYDAVAKLIRGNTAVYSVYIRANSVYTIDGISDGYYRLLFAQGSDWNTITKQFNKNQSYETFEDTFDFETINSQYTTWEVTLEDVIGGNAETSIVNPAEFNAY